MSVSGAAGHDGAVARKLGSTPSPPQPSAALAPPAAQRTRSPGWRDPRLWIGVAIVAGSVVLGARLLAAADETVAVWAAADDLGPGERIDAGDLEAQRVRFADDTDLARYWSADEELPADLTLVRGIGAGELLPRRSTGPAGEADLRVVPVAVDPGLVPSGVGPGVVVDIYVLDGAGALAEGDAGAAGGADAEESRIEGLSVVGVAADSEGFAASGQQRLDLAMSPEQADRYFALLASLGDPVVTVLLGG